MNTAELLSLLDHAATVLLVVGAAVGLVCANLDADAIEADGMPRLASAIRWGRRLGGLALQLRSLKAPDSKPSSALPADKDGAS